MLFPDLYSFRKINLLDGKTVMVKNSAETWRSLFVEWPEKLPKRGVVLSTLNEAMPFRSFMLRDELLLLERANPDVLGSRFILLTFDAINSVKFTDALGESELNQAGFVGKLSK